LCFNSRLDATPPEFLSFRPGARETSIAPLSTMASDSERERRAVIIERNPIELSFWSLGRIFREAVRRDSSGFPISTSPASAVTMCP
jgi:hypothetical protein